MLNLGSNIQWVNSLNRIGFKRASGMIKFLTESCLSELGIVLKEPSAN